MKHRIFVYGSLLSGLSNHKLLEAYDAKLIGTARTGSRFTMLDLGAFPGIVEGNESQIVGEVYEVDHDCFAMLDRLEGYPDFYTRKRIRTSAGRAWNRAKGADRRS